MAGKTRGKRWRAALRAENGRLRKRQVRAIHRLGRRLDRMTDMGDRGSLRLQMAMDRLSKTMAALTSILRKVSETQAAITRAMK